MKEAFSLDGWNFKDWLLGNGKTIKELAKILVPFIVGWGITQNPTATVVITTLGKLVLDTLDYYLKEKA